MKNKLLLLCLISQALSVLAAPKRNLQITHKQLLLQQFCLREKAESQLQSHLAMPIVELCPTKPPKKYSGGHEKVRLQKAIDLLKSQNDALRKITRGQ